ncbi:unnamed protein product, partial [Iphiclides podalirius]
MEGRIFALTLLTASAHSEPPLQGYNYHAPSAFGTANNYLPPRNGYIPPSGSYLPPSTHSSVSGLDHDGHGGHDHDVD